MNGNGCRNPIFNNDDRMALVIKVLATLQRNQNDDDGDKFLSSDHYALETIENITFAYSDFDLKRDSEMGWFGDNA